MGGIADSNLSRFADELASRVNKIITLHKRLQDMRTERTGNVGAASFFCPPPTRHAGDCAGEALAEAMQLYNGLLRDLASVDGDADTDSATKVQAVVGRLKQLTKVLKDEINNVRERPAPLSPSCIGLRMRS